MEGILNSRHKFELLRWFSVGSNGLIEQEKLVECYSFNFAVELCFLMLRFFYHKYEGDRWRNFAYQIDSNAFKFI